MQLDDRLSADIIKIFHNSKGSVQNNIVKWTNHTIDKRIQEETTWEDYSEQTPSPHAASHYDHRLQQKTYSPSKVFEENAGFETPPTFQKSENSHHASDIGEE